MLNTESIINHLNEDYEKMLDEAFGPTSQSDQTGQIDPKFAEFNAKESAAIAEGTFSKKHEGVLAMSKVVSIKDWKQRQMNKLVAMIKQRTKENHNDIHYPEDFLPDDTLYAQAQLVDHNDPKEAVETAMLTAGYVITKYDMGSGEGDALEYFPYGNEAVD